MTGQRSPEGSGDVILRAVTTDLVSLPCGHPAQYFLSNKEQCAMWKEDE